MDHEVDEAPAHDDMLSQIDEIDARLLDGLNADDRLDSGVPEAHAFTDLEFIQMTGLTRPLPSAESSPAGMDGDPPPVEDRSPVSAGAMPSSPTDGVSFFEKGVVDVDASMSPPALDETELYNIEIIPEQPSAAPAEHLPLPGASLAGIQDIIDELTQEQDGSASATRPIEFPMDAEASEPVAAEAPVANETDWAAAEPGETAETAPAIKEAGLPPAPRMAPDLSHVEELIEALEAQPRDLPQAYGDPAIAEPDEMEFTDRDKESIEGSMTAGERDASVYRQPRTKHYRRRSHRFSRHARWTLIRWTVRLALAAAVVVAAAAGYRWTRPLLATPEEMFQRADRLATSGRTREAADVFAQFAQAYPQHPDRAEAQFRAASCYQAVRGGSFDEDQRLRARALDLFEQFVRDNPSHAKAARARTRMGILYFEIERFQDAIDVLQDPALQLKDPEGALPGLRTLAQARWKLGEYDAAISAYLQAASFAGNFTPERDYEELGDLSRWRADHAQTDDERQRFQQAVVGYWNNAARSPTIDPATKSRIKEKQKWVADQLGEVRTKETPPIAKAPAPEAQDTAVPGADPSEPLATPDASQTVDPRVEAQYPAPAPPKDVGAE